MVSGPSHVGITSAIGVALEFDVFLRVNEKYELQESASQNLASPKFNAEWKTKCAITSQLGWSLYRGATINYIQMGQVTWSPQRWTLPSVRRRRSQCLLRRKLSISAPLTCVHSKSTKPQFVKSNCKSPKIHSRSQVDQNQGQHQLSCSWAPTTVLLGRYLDRVEYWFNVACPKFFEVV